MMPPSFKATLIRVMGSKVWDIQQLQTEFNQVYRLGASTRELSNKLRSKEFEVVGTASIMQGWVRQGKTKGYKLYQVREEWRGSL